MPGALDFKVEIVPGWTSFVYDWAGGYIWTDVTDYVEGDAGVSITYGRSDGFSTVEPGRCTLTLDNRDGRFTPDNTVVLSPDAIKMWPCILRVSGYYAGTWVTRFVGDVDEWAISFPGGTPATSVATVTATSPMGRLGRVMEMRGVLKETYRAPGAWHKPNAYYPLTEPSEATTAGDWSAYSQPAATIAQRGSGGTLAFGAGTGPGTDGESAPMFTRASAGNGKYLTATLTSPLHIDGGDSNNIYNLEAWFNTTTAAIQTLVEIVGTTGRRVSLYVTAAGKLAASVYNPSDASLFTATSTTTVTDGVTRMAGMHANLLNSGTGQVVVCVNGVAEASTSITTPIGNDEFPTLSMGGTTVASSSGGVVGDVFNGTLAHVAAWACIGVPTETFYAVDWRYEAGTTGFAGETTGERVSRLSLMAGQQSAHATPDADALTLCAAVDTAGATYLDQMQLAATTEGGILHDTKDGHLRLQSRAARYNPSPAVTLDAATQAVEASLAPTLGDQDVVNDFTVTFPGGTARAVADWSIDLYGAYRGSVDTALTTLAEADAMARFRVNGRGEPKSRIPAVEVDLVNTTTSQILPLLQADISDVLRVTNLPTQANPAATVDLFIEGYTESITGTTWSLSIFGTDASGMTAWVLDDSTFSVLDSTTILVY